MNKKSIFIVIILSLFIICTNSYSLDFGNTDWNLTKKNILNKIRKNQKPEKETKNELVYKDQVNNLLCYEIFNFDNNKLVKISYKFEKFNDVDECEELYSKIYNSIRECKESTIKDNRESFKRHWMDNEMIDLVLSYTDKYNICKGDNITINESCKTNNSIILTKTNLEDLVKK